MKSGNSNNVCKLETSFKKKSAFTLIELLAIIILLSIIAVITVPIILNAINNSRKKSAMDSAYGYVRAIENYRYSSDLDTVLNMNLDGVYVIKDTILSGNSFDNISIPVSGNKSINGWLNYHDDDLINGCLSIGDYAFDFQNGSFHVSDRHNCKLSIKGDFENDDWNTIKTNLILDRNSYDDEIGKIKTIIMNVDGHDNEYKLRLVNTQSPDICSNPDFSETACGVVVEFATVISKSKIGSSTDVTSGWASSEMRNFLNNEDDSIYSMLPDDLKNIIIPTAPIISSSLSGADYNVILASETFKGDYLYLLSGKELGYNFSGELKDGIQYTRILDYYNGADYQSKIKYDVNNLAQEYWLRSAHISTTNAFYNVLKSGVDWHEPLNEVNGVAPSFRIFD